MAKKSYRKTLHTLFALIFIIFSTDSISSIGSDWLFSEVNADGSINSSNAISHDFDATTQAIITLDALGNSDNVGVFNALHFLNINNSDDSVNLALVLLAQEKVGIVNEAIIQELELRAQNDGGVAPFVDYQSNLLDSLFALQALVKTKPTSSLIPLIVNYITQAQLADGSFKLKIDEHSSVYISALASLSLQLVKDEYNLNNEIALITQFLLSKRQLIDTNSADFQTWSTNWESALALLAIINVESDRSLYQTALDKITAAQNINGSWDNDVYTTALALRLLAIIDGTSYVPPLNPSSITAIIIDQSNKQIVVDATIEINTTPIRTTKSAFTGEFNLTNLDMGIYQISVSAPGYQNKIINVNLQESQLLNLGQIELYRSTSLGLLEGIITKSSNDMPLENALISISNVTNTYSNLQGNYKVAIPAGEVNIIISLNGYKTINLTTTIIAGQTTVLSPGLESIGSIGSTLSQLTGSIVSNQDSIPLSQVTMDLSNGSTMQTDANGVFDFNNLIPGQVNISINESGFYPLNLTVYMVAGINNIGKLRLVKIPLETTVTLSGVITDSVSQNPIAGVSVLNSSTGIIVQTDAQGIYKINNISNLQFDITVTKHLTLAKLLIYHSIHLEMLNIILY